MNINAQWIWKKQDNYNLYNQTVVFRKTFNIDSKFKTADLAITADTFYRLYINGKWINDGPSRGYPKHYNYDLLDLSSYLQTGKNEIKVIAKYFGCGTFHQICQQAGFLAQLEINQETAIISDSSWEVAEAKQWIQNTPRIFCQMEAVEFYNAMLEDKLDFEPAAELFSVENSPWQGLMERDCPLLTKKEFSFKKFHSANIVKYDGFEIAIPGPRLCYPGLIDSNSNTSIASGAALIIDNVELNELEIKAIFYEITVNGLKSKNNIFKLKKGKNLLLALNKNMFSHAPEQSIFFTRKNGFTIQNPLDKSIAYPCFLRFPELLAVGSDKVRLCDDPKLTSLKDKINNFYEKIEKAVISEETFHEHLASYAEIIPKECVLPMDFYTPHRERKILSSADNLLKNPEKLMFDDPECTIINPSPDGDVQVIYDLGMQNVGYYDFDLVAEAGLVIDMFEIEHIFSDGRLQGTDLYQNGMRYICKAGRNKFTSLKRRSGRYLIIIFRNQNSDVKIRNFKLFESTYPVEYKGSFRCSDDFMNRLWEISAHTLKLCMEDTYTDCPLYEQTLWVGDARNESLFAYPVFGAWDLSKRCIRIAAESIETLPMVGSQVPSCWDTLIPIWSFLWEISVWEYYFETGDKDFLQEMWGAMVENIAESERRIDQDTGLFSSPTWNLFDWSGSDISQKIVIHNSMFLVGALQAAIKCAEVLGEKELIKHWTKLENRLKVNINKYWDVEKSCWPDSLNDDGKAVDSQSIHNNFLSLLYNIVDEDKRSEAERIFLNPPESMVKVGSPFAMQYVYETLDKLNLPEQIISKFYSSYRIMLEEDATTVWEVFANSLAGLELTRSHCHGWSSSPNYFLNRIVLGIKMTKAGAKAFTISPNIDGFKWASGSCATVRGEVKVSWKKEDDTLKIKASSPAGVDLTFEPNTSTKDLIVQFEKN